VKILIFLSRREDPKNLIFCMFVLFMFLVEFNLLKNLIGVIFEDFYLQKFYLMELSMKIVCKITLGITA